MNSVLKKKVFTAILTAAMVFGVGGMATEPVSTREHCQGEVSMHTHIFEPAVAHAMEELTTWRCYFCGKVTQNARRWRNVNGKVEAYPPDINKEVGRELCPYQPKQIAGHHGWVWVQGVPPVVEHWTLYYCRRCKELDTQQYDRHHRPRVVSGCRANNGGVHDWAPTGIVIR